MAVPKKRTSMSKKRIRKNLWKKKTYFSIGQRASKTKSVKAFILSIFLKYKCISLKWIQFEISNFVWDLIVMLFATLEHILTHISFSTISILITIFDKPYYYFSLITGFLKNRWILGVIAWGSYWNWDPKELGHLLPGPYLQYIYIVEKIQIGRVRIPHL
ncbi:hypothetical protein ACJX0J_001543 [Zea mays]